MDSDKIRGDIQRPHDTSGEKKAPDKIDPEKFKKVMKVDEADETQKRKKRNLPKTEEEGTEEETQRKAKAPSPVTSFSEFMSDKETLGHVFDQESRGIRRQEAPQANASVTPPPSRSISTEGVEIDQENEAVAERPSDSSRTSPTPQEQIADQPFQESSQKSVPSFEYQQPTHPTAGQNTSFSQEEQKPPSSMNETEESKSNQEQSASSQQKEEESVSTQKEKKDEKDTSLLASQPKTKNLTGLKKKKAKKLAPKIQTIPREDSPPKKVKQKTAKAPSQPLEQGSATTPSDKREENQPPRIDSGSAKKAIARKGSSENKLPEEKAKEKSLEGENGTKIKEKTADHTHLFHRLSPKEVRSKKIEEDKKKISMEALSSSPGDLMKKGKQDDKKDLPEANDQTASIPLPIFETPFPSLTPSPNTPAYSKLSPEIYELFEKLGGIILVQQTKGVTTTTVNIQMPGSVFDGTQVVLSQYSTARNSFNIQLVGSPASVKLFNQHLDALKESFKQANFNFETNILTPILTTTKKSPHLIKRAKGGGDKGKREGRDQ